MEGTQVTAECMQVNTYVPLFLGSDSSTASQQWRYTTYWLARNCDLSLLMSWRRVLPDEHFAHQYSPNSGIGRGYAVDSQICLDGHQNCSCHRSKEPEDMTWFLQHNDAEHGIYPVDFETMNDSLMNETTAKATAFTQAWLGCACYIETILRANSFLHTTCS